MSRREELQEKIDKAEYDLGMAESARDEAEGKPGAWNNSTGVPCVVRDDAKVKRLS